MNLSKMASAKGWAVLAVISTLNLLVSGCDSGSGQLDLLRDGIALTRTEISILSLECDGDGPAYTEQTLVAALGLKAIDSTHVEVEVHPGCKETAKVITVDDTDPSDRTFTLALPEITCPWPFSTVDGQSWTASLVLDASILWLRVRSERDEVVWAQATGIFGGTVTRTGSGNAVCDYNFYFPDPT